MANSSIKQHLSDNDFFSGLAPGFIEFLAEHAEARPLEEDEVLFLYGAHADRFYLLCRGSVSVEVAAIEGPTLELQRLGPGAILGWSWLIQPYKWSFQARARAPSEVIVFDGQAVLAHCEEDPRFGYELLKRFSALMYERLHFARQKMMDEFNPPGFA